MAIPAVGDGLDEHGTLASTDVLDHLIHGLTYGQHIITILDEDPRDAVGSGTLIDVLGAHHGADGRRDTVAVIDTVEDHGKIPDRCHIERLVEGAFVGSPVTEAADDDLARLLHLLREGCTDGDTHTTTYDTVGTEVFLRPVPIPIFFTTISPKIIMLPQQDFVPHADVRYLHKFSHF